ncbi:nuclear fragile X mental retardation-interacting protein 1 [Babesia ovis]|uniref:Nuclear fragile X mental retardation-interacting protein 1 n=1 Tax=Babesia ovis TaxID=5869 RepID=A0A9W5WV89_BABOV|nr:nuclear fragile X mental retardation-interacting protein 1 [Babesia ovis]
MTNPYNGNTPYGGAGMPMSVYDGQRNPAFYASSAQYTRYPYYGQRIPPCPPGYPPMTSYYQPRSGNHSGSHRRPPPAYVTADSRQVVTRSNDNITSSDNKVTCEACNMYFRTFTELSEHVEEMHVRCEVEGCDYSAPVDLMSVHALKHVKNHNGEYVLESADEIRKWVANRRNRHPLNRRRDVAAIEDSTLERLLRDAHRKSRNDQPAKSLLYPVISKVRPRPSALLHLSDPVKYRNLLRQSSGPYSYRPSISMTRAICQTFKRTRSCKFGDRCQYSHDFQVGGNRDLNITKRPPALLHVLKKDIYNAEKLLVTAIKTLVAHDFFDGTSESPSASEASSEKILPSV